MRLFFETPPIALKPSVWLLKSWVNTAPLAKEIEAIEVQAPFRHMQVPGGQSMSVAMTNCGALGWLTDATGYRYSATDPLMQKPWPALPPSWQTLACNAAALAGWPGFAPDACLVNR